MGRHNAKGRWDYEEGPQNGLTRLHWFPNEKYQPHHVCMYISFYANLQYLYHFLLRCRISLHVVIISWQVGELFHGEKVAFQSEG